MVKVDLQLYLIKTRIKKKKPVKETTKTRLKKFVLMRVSRSHSFPRGSNLLFLHQKAQTIIKLALV